MRFDRVGKLLDTKTTFKNLLFIYFGDGVDQIKKHHDQTCLLAGEGHTMLTNCKASLMNKLIEEKEGTCSLEIT